VERPPVQFYASERVALLIDGASLFSASKSLGFDIDFKKLLSFFREQARLVRAMYYTTVPEEDQYSSLRPLLDWLDYNGYTMVTNRAKEFSSRRSNSGIEVEMAVDALTLSSNLDHIVIFSGDGAFCPLVAALQQKGKRVSVISTLEAAPGMIADDLRRQADQFIELAQLQANIEKVQRPTNRSRSL
jgi:uncharacterized LabA/DUF88 family protein